MDATYYRDLIKYVNTKMMILTKNHLSQEKTALHIIYWFFGSTACKIGVVDCTFIIRYYIWCITHKHCKGMTKISFNFASIKLIPRKTSLFTVSVHYLTCDCVALTCAFSPKLTANLSEKLDFYKALATTILEYQYFQKHNFAQKWVFLDKTTKKTYLLPLCNSTTCLTLKLICKRLH